MNAASMTIDVPLWNNRVKSSGYDHEIDVEVKIQGHASTHELDTKLNATLAESGSSRN